RDASRYLGGTTWFWAASHRAMNQELVDHARAKNRLKRGKGRRPVPLSQVADRLPVAPDVEELFENAEQLHRSLGKLRLVERKGPRMVRVIELHYFERRSWIETAEVLGISTKQVQRDWRFARTWLYEELSANPE
ncbi:MAG: hypothetical protein GF355_02390, partial [Candidatus Eisenbacteria bacterium]|nr:hypothetical protein [Candidatus Eisenbacteria bacterium]